MAEYYVGLMSGTSMDGIDAVLVDLQDSSPKLIAARVLDWPADLHRRLTALIEQPGDISLAELGRVDAAAGEAFADAALAVIRDSGVDRANVRAIGSHGQTLFHAPGDTPPFTHQCGDPNRIAQRTGITTVADFRRRDIAAGGQGAPLAPAFHQAVFASPRRHRAVLNIGGMANLTLLPAGGTASGFDTGPGNVLMDAWCQRRLGKPFDADGAWAASGRCLDDWLRTLLEHPFLRQPPPRSTGRETFCADWLDEQLARLGGEPAAADVQRTLLEFTVSSIADALLRYAADTEQLLVCGGGAHNGALMRRLGERLPGMDVASTAAVGLHPDWVEAVAFAWLAKQTLDGRPGNLPAVTGAAGPVVLGAIHPA